MPVRLSSNESPFGASPQALAAAQQALSQAHRYPDDQSNALRAALAERAEVEPDHIAVGTGSAAVLMDLIPVACHGHPTPEVLAFEHAFVVYRLAARNAAAIYREVPIGPPPSADGDGYARDVDTLLAAVGDDTAVVVVDNPGNPLGVHLDGAQLQRLASELPAHVTLIIDEAYHHFATGQRGYRRAADLELDHEQVVVLTTFSKAYALAGLRVGAATGPLELIAALDARRPRFNLTAPAQAAALAALADEAHLARTVAGTLEGRDRLAGALRSQGVRVTEGLGNFVTLELDRPAAEVVTAFAGSGIGIRPLGPYGLDEQVRITIGTPEEISAVIAAAREVFA